MQCQFLKSRVGLTANLIRNRNLLAVALDLTPTKEAFQTKHIVLAFQVVNAFPRIHYESHLLHAANCNAALRALENTLGSPGARN